MTFRWRPQPMQSTYSSCNRQVLRFPASTASLHCLAFAIVITKHRVLFVSQTPRDRLVEALEEGDSTSLEAAAATDNRIAHAVFRLFVNFREHFRERLGILKEAVTGQVHTREDVCARTRACLVWLRTRTYKHA